MSAVAVDAHRLTAGSHNQAGDLRQGRRDRNSASREGIGVTGAGKPDEANARFVGDGGVAPRVAHEKHLVRSYVDQSRPLRELLCLGVVGTPPVDCGREYGQPMAIAESVDELCPGAAAHQHRHTGAAEPGEGGPGVGERSTTLDEGLLLAFEPGRDVLGPGIAPRDGIELGGEVVARGGEVAASSVFASEIELGRQQRCGEAGESAHGVGHGAVEVERHGADLQVIGAGTLSPPRRPQPHADYPDTQHPDHKHGGEQSASVNRRADGAEGQNQ